MREIVLDTETTGFDPVNGDRIVEIGCIELENHLATGQIHHVYINPERDMPEAAFRVHGLSEEMLRDKPVFAEIANAFLEFIADSPLVIHNASFDIGFLNAELERTGNPPIPMSRAIDTLDMARKKHPFGPNSLDALCRRYGIDNSARQLHGALLDCELLAEVYLELIGGRQPGLTLEHNNNPAVPKQTKRTRKNLKRTTPLPIRLDKNEIEAHQKLVTSLGENALWKSC
jgi:DNA polymerase-3 subunit epsilon